MYPSLNVSDIDVVSWNQTGPGKRSEKKSYDEWGCGWYRTEVESMGQVKEHPLSNWAALDSYRWPDPDNPDLFKEMRDKFAGAEGKYIITNIFMLLFERMYALRGFQQLMVDFFEKKEKVELLADKIVSFDIRLIENISDRFPGRIHGLFFTDDWGDERSLLISPELWRDFFKPRYERILDVCKKVGWHVWMHSCGKIDAIVPDLIEIGVDVLNFQQPRILGIEAFGSLYAGKVCFLSSCDIQHTLPRGTDAEIEQEARLLLSAWATDRGGFILEDDFDNDECLGIPMEKRKTMYQAFVKYDRWKAG